MKKFSKIGDALVAQPVSLIAKKVEKLMETLSVEIEGHANPWASTIEIARNEAFDTVLLELVNAIYEQEKRDLLESARTAIMNRDLSWINEQVQSLNESKH